VNVGLQLAETEDGQQGFVYSPLLFGADPAYQASQPSGVDGPDLLHQHAGLLAKHVDLGAERRRPRALRCRSYEYYRPRQKLVGLDDHPISAATLLVSRPAWRAEFVNVTPQHACSP